MKRIVTITSITVNIHIDPFETRLPGYEDRVKAEVGEILDVVMPFKENAEEPVRKKG